MPTPIYHDFAMSDPREQPVAVRVDPDVDPWLTLTPPPLDGATQASIHRAYCTQRYERERALAEQLPSAVDDLTTTQLIDSMQAQQVVAVLPRDLPESDRQQAAAVAVRLHDAQWQTVSRYRAATAALISLRNLFHRHGIDGTVTERELREAADNLARVTHVARLRCWDGQEPVGAREWAKAQLGFLSVTEER